MAPETDDEVERVLEPGEEFKSLEEIERCILNNDKLRFDDFKVKRTRKLDTLREWTCPDAECGMKVRAVKKGQRWRITRSKQRKFRRECSLSTLKVFAPKKRTT